MAYRGEFQTYEADSRSLGADVLAMALSTVAKKFYEILVRSDVGMVDWEDNYIMTFLIQGGYLSDRLTPQIIMAYDFEAGSGIE